MNKFLTESGWKTEAQKFKLKDATLQKALADYAKLGEEKYADRHKALEHIGQIAGNLKKSKECMAQSDVEKYLAEVIKAEDAEKKQVDTMAIEKAVAANKAAAEAVKAKMPPKPTDAMLREVRNVGINDGENGDPSRRSLFAKIPEFQKEYDFGYGVGRRLLEKGPQPPQTSMSPISKEDEERAKEYDRRRQARKEFIQYANEWWSTALPEDL